MRLGFGHVNIILILLFCILRLHKRRFAEFLILISASFAIFLILCSSLPSLSLPYGDTWDTPVRWVINHKSELSGKFADETFANRLSHFFSAIFSQHNESRKVTLKLLALSTDFYIPAFGAAWNILSFVIRALTVLVVTLPLSGMISRRLSGRAASGKILYLTYYLLVGYGLFVYATGPANLWNGLWEVQTSFFLGILFAMLAIGCYGKLILNFANSSFHSARDNAAFKHVWYRLLGNPALAIYASVFSWISIFSFSGNVGIAIVCAGLWIYGTLLNFRRGISVAGLMRCPPFLYCSASLASMFLSVGLFFHGWSSVPGHDYLRGGLNLRYILFFLGNFYQTLISPSSILYCLALLPVVFLGLAGLYFLKSPSQCPQIFLITGSQLIFLLGLACASSIGRSGGGVEYALGPRYNSISILYSYLSILLFFGLTVSYGIARSFNYLMNGLVVLGILVGVNANLKWYGRIYSHRDRLKRSEQCFNELYLAKTSPEISNVENSECYKEWYPDYESLGSWFAVNACFDHRLLAISATARKVCDGRTSP